MRIGTFRRANVWPAVLTAGTFVLAAALIAARRPDQIAFPEAWNEDGLYVVPQLIESGWRSIFVPIAGYLIIPTKAISYLALWISFVYYPAVSTALGVAVQALCVTVVARVPTVMPARLMMAAAVVFLPINPEPFVLPQYTLWWTPLLIFVAFLWSGAPGSPWRYLFVILGGISGPIVIMTLPALALNAAVRRRKEETFLLITAVIVAAIQVYYVVTTGASSTNTFRVELLSEVVETFFGLLTWAGQSEPLARVSIGLLIAGLLAGGVFVLPEEDRLPYCLLGGCLVGTIASALYRAPVLAPVNAGPRFFFYPFILELWMFIWLAARISSPLKALPVLVLVAVVPLSVANFQRRQDRATSWSANARACGAGVDTTFQIQHDGNPQLADPIFYPHAVCQKAINHAIFDR